MSLEHVHGKDAGDIKLYALSTCGWCKLTRELLEKLGVAYDYVYVDLQQGDERSLSLKEVERWNSSRSFPIIVINGEKCIVGFKEHEIREALRL